MLSLTGFYREREDTGNRRFGDFPQFIRCSESIMSTNNEAVGNAKKYDIQIIKSSGQLTQNCDK